MIFMPYYCLLNSHQLWHGAWLHLLFCFLSKFRAGAKQCSSCHLYCRGRYCWESFCNQLLNNFFHTFLIECRSISCTTLLNITQNHTKWYFIYKSHLLWGSFKPPVHHAVVFILMICIDRNCFQWWVPKVLIRAILSLIYTPCICGVLRLRRIYQSWYAKKSQSNHPV